MLWDEMFTVYYRNKPCPHCVTSFSIGVKRRNETCSIVMVLLDSSKNTKLNITFIPLKLLRVMVAVADG